MRLALSISLLLTGLVLAQEQSPPAGNLQPQPEPRAPFAVGGKAEHEIETRVGVLEDGQRGEFYVAGPMRTTAALPEGYPRPTPAELIEIKHYPSVRRAEIEVEASPRWGMNMAFGPLFRHIQNRDIAMTAPVEADVPALSRERREAADGQGPRGRTAMMTVSFLYRTVEQGQTGPAEERVRVVDAKPTTVVALGLRGVMDNNRIEREIVRLDEWLEAQGETNPGPDGEPAAGRWRADGPPRVLGYSGPDVRRRDQWWEVQQPIVWEATESISPTP